MTIKYAALQATYWMSACFFYSFTQTFLSAKGLSEPEVGFVLAISNIAAFLIQPIVAALMDRNRRVTFRSVISLLAGAATLAGVAVYFAQPKLIVSILFITLTTLMVVVQPLVNSIGFVYVNRGEKLNYAASRGIGSAFYALVALVYGRLAVINVDYLLVGYVVLSIIFLAIELWLSPKKDIVQQTTNVGGNFALLKKHPHFFLMLVGMTLLFLEHNLINAYLLSIVENVGGAKSDVGVAVFIAAGLEVPVMMLYTRIQTKVGVEKLIKFAAVFFTIKSAILLGPFGLTGVFVSQALQLAGYAILIPATGYYVNAMVVEEDRVKGQALLTASIAIAGVFGYLLGGILMGSLTVFSSVLIGTGISVLGTIIMLASTKRILPRE